MMDGIDRIHQFWFRGIDDQTPINNSQWPFKMWFMKDEKLDREIKENFEADLLKAADGEYADWEKTTKGRLALILLYDQFTRNMYRNTPTMFAYDQRALALTLKTINEKKENELQLIERVFLFMPLQHSEDINIQKLSLECFRTLIDGSRKINPANVPYYEYTFGYAQRHFDIIKRFNRFPHRNAILKRDSTPEEEAFLKKPGSGF